MNDETRWGIQACLDCHRACLETVVHLQASGALVESAHIRLLFNCAELCQTNASLLRGRSDVAWRASGACADVCEQCAAYCDEFAKDPIMRRCAEACRRCAAACQRVAAMAA